MIIFPKIDREDLYVIYNTNLLPVLLKASLAPGSSCTVSHLEARRALTESTYPKQGTRNRTNRVDVVETKVSSLLAVSCSKSVLLVDRGMS